MPKNIIVYSKADCMPCGFTKNFLSNNNVEFEERNVTEHPEFAEEVKALGFQTLPVIMVEGNEPFFGFQPDKLSELF